MSWLHVFEILCYLITGMLVIDIVKSKRENEPSLFLSAAVSGYLCELLAVRFSGLYHYNPNFYFNIGPHPHQFPFFGGLMWAGITVCSFRIASKLGFGKGMTALSAGWLIVSLDLLLDVCAIRLNGGFWVWEGLELNQEINHHAFMSVIWTNYLGYLFETPAIIYLSMKSWQKKEDHNKKQSKIETAKENKISFKKLFRALRIGFYAVMIVGLASIATLYLNQLTKDWFAFIAFLILWFYIFFALVQKLRQHMNEIEFKGNIDWTLCLYWIAMYGYCLLGLWNLGLFHTYPMYGIFALFLALGTLCLCLMPPITEANLSQIEEE